MQRYVGINAENRIVSTTVLEFPQDQPIFNFPDDFDFEKQADYKIINGNLAYDPIPVDASALPDPITQLRADVDLLLLESFIAKGVISGDAS